MKLRSFSHTENGDGLVESLRLNSKALQWQQRDYRVGNFDTRYGTVSTVHL